MFGSETLELAIGMVFVFLLVSMICTAVREGIEAWLKTRAAYLEHGIRELLHDTSAEGLAKALYEHPLISSLYEGKYTPAPSHAKRGLLPGGRLLPSYIPSRSFALAMMDLAARGPADASTSGPAAAPLSVQAIRDNIASIQNPAVQRVLLTALDAAGDDLDRVRKNVEAWFDSGMDRVSGWYKRSTQIVLLLIGLFVAVVLNVNAITIFSYLSHNDTARKVIVASAGNATTDSAYLHRTLEQNRAALDSLRLPIGWDKYRLGAFPGTKDSVAITDAKGRKTGYRYFTLRPWETVFQPLLGWLIIALAATLGAPFWFDVLNRLIVLRSTVKPHEKSPEEASKDRQKPTPTPGSQGGEADEQEKVNGGGGTGSGSGGGRSTAPGTGGGAGTGDTGTGTGGTGGASPATGAGGGGGATGDGGRGGGGGAGGAGAGDDDDQADGCDVEVTEPTPDEELPAAEGGVA
jgi:hypothetical protein